MAWSSIDLVLSGTFASADDLRAAVDELRRVAGGPVVVATFSSQRPLPSLILARDRQGADAAASVSRLDESLRGFLKSARDKHAYVARQVVNTLSVLGCRDATTLGFGGRNEQPGRLGVVIGGPRMGEEQVRRAVDHVAACALGSRPAAVSLETSLELTTLSELARAIEPPSNALMVAATRVKSRHTLLEFADGVLETEAIIAYEARSDQPHRFQRLRREDMVLNFALRAPEWLPETVEVGETHAVPDPPEVGGSRYADLGALVQRCFKDNRGRPRPLAATIADEFTAYGVPYGFDEVRRQPIGVLCLLWSRHDINAYDMAMSRVIALHLARSYNNRHRDWSVRLVTRQLQDISQMRSVPRKPPPLVCDPILADRHDVRLIAQTVVNILKGLVNLSGAMSVTCRLIAGAEGDDLERFVVRLHCEGEPNKEDSDSKIRLTQNHSVNAWVARNGKRVYLRDLLNGTSTDLRDYPGLDSPVAMFRDDVRSELCVPIFAEHRLVGTVNLEADRKNAFDAVSETVAEYAHLIGIALLEARRLINVDTVTQIGGFLDHRHRLEAELIDLADRMLKDGTIAEPARRSYVGAIGRIQKVVFLPRLADTATFGDRTTVHDVVEAAMKSLEWTGDDSLGLRSMTVGGWTDAAQQVCGAEVGQEVARALWFAVGQALYNIRQHSDGADEAAGREQLAMLRFGRVVLGGAESIYVVVSSTCDESTFEDLNPEVVFRQPIVKDGRMSLGTFLSGEALRRVGGSAYLRLTESDEHDWLVDAEFSVPVLPPSADAEEEAETDEEEAA